MRRNTNLRRNSGGLVPIVTSALLVCLAVAVALLGHIRLKAELNRVYADIDRLDRQLAEVRRLNHKLGIDYELLTSTAGLNNRIRDMRLQLVMPGDGARFVMAEPAAEPALPLPGPTPAERSAGRVLVNLAAGPSSSLRP